MWFKELAGFDEQSTGSKAVYENISIKGQEMYMEKTGRSHLFGRLETVSLAVLQDRSAVVANSNNRASVREIVADVAKLHALPENKGAFFQAASQFNLLEMVSPSVTPEEGVTIYAYDKTQGPACAIACGAGTIYRNYFAKVGDRLGQSANSQLNMLSGIADILKNEVHQYWTMRNGYALLDSKKAKDLNTYLKSLDNKDWEALKQKLQIGVQWDTEVTSIEARHLVTQAYCSAVPVAYADASPLDSELFCRLILEAAYEASLYAALENYTSTGNPKVYLTLLGGGVFGNELSWILDALAKALDKFRQTDLAFYIVSYGQSNPSIQLFCQKHSS